MSNKVVLYECTTAIRDRNRYSLIVYHDGFVAVEHAWIRYNASGTAKVDEGEAVTPVDRFLSGDHDTRAQEHLRAHLARINLQGEAHA